jgi:molybdate transport system ATP-binding protein
MCLSVDITLPRDSFTLRVRHDFAPGGITTLFGPSGCGKSSLLRVIAGFEPGARGRVALDGQDWQSPRFTPPHKRGLGYVFQDARLFPHLSVAGNLAYAERRARPTPAPLPREEVLDALGVRPLLHRAVQDLSGGERQRVSIARSLLSQPRWLLMDEPLAALDHRARAAILPMIADLPVRFGLPVIYVTHALDEVAQISDHVLTLSQGTVQAAGPVSEMLERPDLQALAGRFEAGAILPGTIASHDPDMHLTRVDVQGLSFEMPFLDAPIGTPLRLRVRARDVTLATTKPTGISARNIHPARILALRPEADTAFTEVLLDLGPAHLQARITRAAVRDLGLSEGQHVYALIKSVSFDRRALPGIRPVG